MKYIVTINNKNYEVEVEKGQANIIKTTEVAIEKITINTVAPSIPTLPVVSPSTATGESIKSPITGTIIDIKISTGTKVKKGDILFIIEAMKMENEIFAPIDGVVVQILAVKGSSVSANDLLAVIN